MPLPALPLFAVLSCLLPSTGPGQVLPTPRVLDAAALVPEAALELTLELDEVSDAELAISADGRTLFFPLLGDLVAISSEGGEAQILTRGPAYDRCPMPQADGELWFLSDQQDHQDALYRWREGAAAVRLGSLRRGVPTLGPGGRPASLDAGRAWVHEAQWTAQERDLGSFRRLLDCAGPALCGVLSSEGPDRLVVHPPDGPESIIATEGRVLWGGVDAQARLAVVGLELADGASPIAEEVHVLDLSTGEVLHREHSGPARRDGEARPCRPAFHEGRAWFPLGGRIRCFDTAARTCQDLEWTARLRFSRPQPPAPLSPGSARRIQSPAGEEWSPSAVDAFDLSAGEPRIVFSAAGDLWLSEGEDLPFRLTQDDARQEHPRFDPGDDARILFTQDGTLYSIDDLGDDLQELRVAINGPFELSSDGASLLLAGFGGAARLDRETGIQVPLITAPGLPRNWGLHPTPGAEQEVIHCGGTPVQLVASTTRSASTAGRVLTRLSRPPSRPCASADGAWLAFLRDGRAWLGRRGTNPLGEADFTAVGPVGVHALRFDPASERLWMLAGSTALAWRLDRQEIELERSLAVQLPTAAPAAPLILTAVDVYPGQGEQLLRAQRLEIEGGRIRVLRPEADCTAPRPGVQVIDGRGLVAVPGLIDAHVHSPSMALQGAVAWGVTWMRDVGGSYPESWTTEERARTAQVLPRLVRAGEIFEGSGPYWGDAFHVVEDAAEALALLTHRAEAGMDLVKVYPSLPRSLRAVVLAEASRRGLPSTGHADHLRMIVTSISDGLGSFEHVPSSPIHGDVIALMAAAGVAWCPTLCVMGGGDVELRSRDESGQPREWSSSRFRAAVPDWHQAGSRARAYYAWSGDENLAALVDERCRSVARAARAGVPILVGSDAPNSNCFHGPGTHWEMALLVRGGLRPAEALRAATSNPAAHLGLPELGRLQAGSVADVVLLDADPLQDIRNTQRIRQVILAGRLLDPDYILGLPPTAARERD